MARVDVIMPPEWADDMTIPHAIAEAGRIALDATLPDIMGRIAASGTVPHNNGALTAAVASSAQPARIEGTKIVAWIVVAGEASAYAAVQDLGRHPGRPLSWRVLYYAPGQIGVPNGWRGGWVNRRLRDRVLELAGALQAEETEARVARKGSKRQRARKNFEARAAFLLARAIARSIRERGMAGKQFLTAQRETITAECRTAVEAEIALVLGGGAA